MSLDIVTIGETMAAVIPVQPMPLDSADVFRVEAAGAESTVALYLQDLGHHTAWLSRLGNDPLGRRVSAAIGDRGVDTSMVVLDQTASTGVYFKDPRRGGTALYYYRKGSAASCMSPQDLERMRSTSAQLVHLTGVTPGLSPSCRALVDAVLDRARSPKTLVSFDVNFRLGVWSVENAGPTLLRLARQADVVFVGRDEAATLWGTRTARDVRALLPSVPYLVVKDGANGATEFGSHGEVFVPSHTVEVVEEVGAGDAFAAGYLSGLLNGRTTEERLDNGHRMAVHSLTSLTDYAPANHSNP
jgi:2-dehydro-3-deoxygluconokinase